MMKKIIIYLSVGVTLLAGFVPIDSDDKYKHKKQIEAEIHNNVLKLTIPKNPVFQNDRRLIIHKKLD